MPYFLKLLNLKMKNQLIRLIIDYLLTLSIKIIFTIIIFHYIVFFLYFCISSFTFTFSLKNHHKFTTSSCDLSSPPSVFHLQILQVQQSRRPDSRQSTCRKYSLRSFLCQFLKLLIRKLFLVQLIRNLWNVFVEIVLPHLLYLSEHVSWYLLVFQFCLDMFSYSRIDSLYPCQIDDFHVSVHWDQLCGCFWDGSLGDFEIGKLLWPFRQWVFVRVQNGEGFSLQLRFLQKDIFLMLTDDTHLNPILSKSHICIFCPEYHSVLRPGSEHSVRLCDTQGCQVINKHANICLWPIKCILLSSHDTEPSIKPSDDSLCSCLFITCSSIDLTG